MRGHAFDRSKAGGAVRRLSTLKINAKGQGVNVIERHLERFGPDEANRVMIDRLRLVASGLLEPTQYDFHFYAHELQEFVRYRRAGLATGGGDDYELWSNAHSATLEGYGLDELDENRMWYLFHPDAWPFLLH